MLDLDFLEEAMPNILEEEEENSVQVWLFVYLIAFIKTIKVYFY